MHYMWQPLIVILFSLFSFITGAASPGDEQQAELLFVGDAMQHQAQLDRAKELGKGSSFSYEGCLDLIAPAIIKADYAVCNLEVPLGGGRGGYTGFPCFSAPDTWATTLQNAGFDMMLTANNHTLDRSDYGLRRTLTVLDSIKADHIGTYRNAAERKKLMPFLRKVKGFNIGFLNYTYGTNGITARDGAEVSLIDKAAMAREIAATRKAGAEIIVVCIHWGVEYQLHENSSQRNLAEFLADQGVDLIIGSHPHVIQPMQIVHNEKNNKDVLVVYSLGNFISNMKTDDTRGGAMVKAIIKRNKEGQAYLDRATYDIFYAAKPWGNSNFQVIPSWRTALIPAGQKGWWNTFAHRAMNIFNTCNINVEREAPEPVVNYDTSK